MVLRLRATPLPLSVQILEPDISHSAVHAKKYLLQEDMTIKAAYLSRPIKTFAFQDLPLLNGSTPDYQLLPSSSSVSKEGDGR